MHLSDTSNDNHGLFVVDSNCNHIIKILNYYGVLISFMVAVQEENELQMSIFTVANGQ